MALATLLACAVPYLVSDSYNEADSFINRLCLNRAMLRFVLSIKNCPLPMMHGWPMRILTVGDGNLTFSLGLQRALANSFGQLAHLQTRKLSTSVCSDQVSQSSKNTGKVLSLVNIVATTFDDETSLFEKYPESRPVKRKLLQFGVRVIHGINATALPSDGIGTFSVIIFNHPHLGVEDAAAHRVLLAHFFFSCQMHLRANGKIYISLVEGQPERWKLIHEAERAGYKLLSSAPMAADAFPGYEIRRTHTGRSFVNSAAKRQSNFSQTSTVFCFTRHMGSLTKTSISQYLKQSKATPRLHPAAAQSTTIASSSNLEASKPPDTSTSTSKCHSEGKGKGKKRKRVVRQDQLMFPCKECDRAFSTAQGLRTHTHQVHVLKLYDAHLNMHASRVECPTCKRTFAGKNALENHTRAKHGRDPAIPAHWRQYERQSYKLIFLGEVSSSAHLSSSGRILCKICNCLFPNQSIFREHFVSLKPIVKPHSYPCRGCGKNFKNERALRQHLNFCTLFADKAEQLST